jgi:DNA-binding response OmpR family regulator
MTLTPHKEKEKTRTVLVIEDDEHTNLLISENLKMAGYRVVSVYDGEEGVKAAFKHTPDLIMLDLMLPRLNGWEVCKQLRQENSAVRGVPIIIVSVLSKEAQPQKQSVGPLTLINKPFDVKSLLSEVQRVIRETDGQK